MKIMVMLISVSFLPPSVLSLPSSPYNIPFHLSLFFLNILSPEPNYMISLKRQ